MTYFIHIGDDIKPLACDLGKIVCVGRNYHDHIDELNNQQPDEPVIFIKP